MSSPGLEVSLNSVKAAAKVAEKIAALASVRTVVLILRVVGMTEARQRLATTVSTAATATVIISWL
ncbi:MAG: hypothetical protein WCT03_03755 [Candidatus Obscuribacterales bacterium]|jgi:hypothetical protein